MKKRLKKFQLAGIYGNAPSNYNWYGLPLNSNNTTVEITGMNNENLDDNQQSSNNKEEMNSLPNINYSLEQSKPVMKAEPIKLNTSIKSKETNYTNPFGFDLQKYMQMNFLNDAMTNITSGINDRRIKKSMIDDRASNVSYTPLGSEVNRYGYGYGKRGGLMKMATGGMIDFMFNDDNREPDDEDDYDESSINVEDRERLSEEEVEAAAVQEQVQAEMLRKQQRKEYLRKIINRSRENNLNSLSYEDNENYDVDIPENQSEQFEIIKQAANKHGVPASILAGVYGAETGFGKHSTMVSSAGAQGPFQFMPQTAKQFGINPWNFSEAADGAARYLAGEYKRFGNWPQAVAAYNAGAGNIQKGIMPTETRAYVPKVMSIANKFSQKGFQQGGVMKQYKRAGQVNAPIYTTDKNKVRNYTDSLNLYNNFKDAKSKYIKLISSQGFNPSYIEEWSTDGWVDKDIHPKIGAVKYGILQNSGGGYERDSKGNVRNFNVYPTISSSQRVFDDTELGKMISTRYPIYKKPVQPYILQKEPNIPFLKSPQMGMNKTPVNIQGVPVNIPKLNYDYKTEWETKVYETPARRVEWKEPVQKITNMYYKKGGVNTTGYTPGYDTFENDFNIIPSTDITMKETPFDVIGIDKSGLMQYMRPGGRYNFLTPPVLEIPAFNFMAQGGININPANKGKFTASAKRASMGVQEFAQKVLANKENYSPTQVKRANFARNAAKWNKQMGGHMGANMRFPVYSQNRNDSYIDSLKPYKRGDVYYVDTATLANLKTANINFKHI